MARKSSPAPKKITAKMDPQAARKIYEALVRCRKFEDKVVELYPQKEMKCPTHLSLGQEGAAAGVCAALRKDDYVFSTHRCHSHTIAKGGDFKLMMAELYGKSTGCSHGKGGSMHFVQPDMGLMGASAIVGGTIPLAVGTALASQMQGKDRVSVAFFGDGAIEQGSFHESMNFSSLKKLPVLFICENNDLATVTHLDRRQPYPELYQHAQSYKIPGVRTDGTKAETVYAAAVEAVARARSGGGPSLIEILCYRWKEHVGPNFDYQLGHRTKEELEYQMAEKDPVKIFEVFAAKKKLLSEETMRQISDQVQKQVEDAVVYAKESPFPQPEEMFTDF